MQKKILFTPPSLPISPWECSDATFLDSYLVQETENPALNGQSVLLRAMLADSLFPGKFDTLIADELSYSAAAMFLLKSRRQGWFPQLRERLLAILSGSPDSGPEETRPPAFLTAPASFSLPELMDALVRAQVAGFDDFPSPFAARWRDALDTIPTPPMPVPVLELGCGSANDSRYFSRYGLARFLRYTGVDFTRKNIANAQARCPESTFIAADVAALPFADDAFDYTFACDLWEHIPEAHFEKALREALRVTRKELWFSFFNLDWFPGHEFDSSGDRPMNRLSREQLKDFFAREAGGSYRIDIAREWPERFPGYTHYNPNAALLVVCARKRG